MSVNADLLIVGNYGAKLSGHRLEVWFNFTKDLDRDGKNFYGGSATTVLLDGKEALDPYRALTPWLYMFHDHEKRCMQIDQLQFWDEQSNAKLGCPINMLGLSYELESHSKDKNVVSITIISSPFRHNYKGTNTNYCLRRTITLHVTSDLLAEELSVECLGADNVNFIPKFSVRYFSYVAWGNKEPQFYWDKGNPYFAVGHPTGPGPYPGYGFVSNTSIQSINSPAPNYPFPSLSQNSFSWALSPSKAVTCWHLFMYSGNFEARVRDSWTALKNQVDWRVSHA